MNLRQGLQYTISAVAALFVSLPGVLAAPLFQDRANEQDFEHIYSGGWEHYVGGGLATFDCNKDALPDLYVAGGENSSKLLINMTDTLDGKLRFSHRPQIATDLTHVIGAYPLDLDSDGVLDLFVLRVGENIILRGLGQCRFERANEVFGFDGSDRWTTAFSATFEDGEGLPTLAVGNYVDRDDPNGPFRACEDIKIYRPDGDLYGAPLLLGPGYCTLSMLFSDWGRTGNTDLRVSNDRHYYVRGGSEQMVRMEKPPRFLGPEDGWETLSIWGMGIASRDITRDGLPDIFLTSMNDQKLLLSDGLNGNPPVKSSSYARGTTAHVPYGAGEGRPSTGWHAEFGDVDNDGRDDLFIAKGNVDQMPDAAMQDPNNLLMLQDDGIFVEAGGDAGVGSTARSRGGSVADLNNDGLLDIVVVNRRANLELLENQGPSEGTYVKVRPLQTGLNTSAVGGWIELRSGGRSIWREITVGGGHASGRDGYQHFGLGEAGSIELRIHWPDGTTSEWQSVEAGTTHSLVREEDD